MTGSGRATSAAGGQRRRAAASIGPAAAPKGGVRVGASGQRQTRAPQESAAGQNRNPGGRPRRALLELVATGEYRPGRHRARLQDDPSLLWHRADDVDPDLARLAALAACQLAVIDAGGAGPEADYWAGVFARVARDPRGALSEAEGRRLMPLVRELRAAEALASGRPAPVAA